MVASSSGIRITRVETINLELPESRAVMGENVDLLRARHNYFCEPVGVGTAIAGTGLTSSRRDYLWSMSDEGFEATRRLREVRWEEFLGQHPDGRRNTATIYRLHTDDGLVGLSEVPPADPDFFIGRSPFEFIGDDSVGGFQMALYDLMGKATGLPAARLIGPTLQPRVRVSYWSGCWSPEVMRAETKRAVAKGFKAHKIKRRPLHDIVEQLEAMAEVMPDEYSITIDSNASLWTPERAIAMARELESFPQVHALETPIPQDNTAGYQLLRAKLELQIIVDRPDSYWHVLANGMCDGLKIDMAGVENIRRTAAVAEEGGHVPFFMDSQGLGIADTFMVHIAATIRNATLPHGVLSYLYADHLFTGRMAVEDGHVELSDAPGLGIELDEEAVERYRTDRAR